MAEYNEKYGLVFDGQGNQNWGLTLHIPEKVPLTTNSIFDTYAHMLAYVNNPTSSAIQGLTLAVVNDDDANKNGIYYIKTIGTKGSDGAALNNGEVVKLSTAADSVVSADAVQENLNKEISARTEADKEIYSAITSAKTELTESISNLSTANTEAHNSLKSNIDYISGVTSGIVETHKVKNVKEGDKVLSVDTSGILSSELSIDYNSTNKKIYLKGISGEVISEIDATDFIKDGMLNKAELVTSGGKTELVFSFNTDGGTDTVKVDVTSLLNGTELQNLQLALDTHIASANTQHFRAEERAEFDSLINNYNKTKLDTKFNEISSALTANTEAHGNLSSEIASAKTDISTVSEQVSTISGQVSSISGEVSTVKSNVSAISGEVSTVKSNVSAISGDVKTISDKISENEEVVAEALTDLKANKVSSVISEEGSNIVVNEVKDENGISYTIGFQWLTF